MKKWSKKMAKAFKDCNITTLRELSKSTCKSATGLMQWRNCLHDLVDFSTILEMKRYLRNPKLETPGSTSMIRMMDRSSWRFRKVLSFEIEEVMDRVRILDEGYADKPSTGRRKSTRLPYYELNRFPLSTLDNSGEVLVYTANTCWHDKYQGPILYRYAISRSTTNRRSPRAGREPQCARKKRIPPTGTSGMVLGAPCPTRVSQAQRQGEKRLQARDGWSGRSRRPKSCIA